MFTQIILIQSQLNDELKNYLSDNLSHDNDLLLGTLVLIAFNIIITSLNWFSEVYLRRKDYKNQRKIIFLENSIQIQAQVFKMLSTLSNYYIENEREDYNNQLKSTRKFINLNKTFLTHKLENIANEFLDYFGLTLSNISHKDVAKENELLNQYCKEFRE